METTVMGNGTTERFYLSGDTYPVKDGLKALGCRYDGDRKQWYAPDEATAAKAREVIKGGAVVSGTVTTGDRRKFFKCQVCGVKASRYVRIYASGECRDCLEERKMGY